MATPAQIAARERFAELVRSGAFKRKAKRKANPLSRVKVNSPSQRGDGRKVTAKDPETKRLYKRRRATEAAPAGYYANPSRDSFPFIVERAIGSAWHAIAGFTYKGDAVDYARAYHRVQPHQTIRVTG